MFSEWKGLGGLTGEHGDLINVGEMAIGCTFKTSPEIRDEDLGSFVEANLLALEGMHIVEAGEVVNEEIDECSRGIVGLLNTCSKAAVKALNAVSDRWGRSVLGHRLPAVCIRLLECSIFYHQAEASLPELQI